MTEITQIQEKVRNFIVQERFEGNSPEFFTDDFDLIDSGSIDSLFMVRLITYLEREFPIEFRMNDFVPKNFKSVNALSELVKTRMK